MLFDYDVSQGVLTGGHSQLTRCLTTGNPYTHREDAQYGGALEKAFEAIAKLTSDPKNIVYIISGRDQDFLEHHFGHFKTWACLLSMVGSSENLGMIDGQISPKVWTWIGWAKFTRYLSITLRLATRPLV